MVKELDLIISMNVEEVINSSHSATLLKLYSICYLGGKQPRACAASQRKYYNQLKKNYKMSKEKLEKTHVLVHEKRFYIDPVKEKKTGKLIGGHFHIHPNFLTDEQARKYLKSGELSKEDFIKLPDEKKEEKPEPVEYSKEMLKEIVEGDNFNLMAKAARELKLVGVNPNKAQVTEALTGYINKEESPE
jgi:hypothetical protein